MIDASGLPFATMFMDKSVLDETHPCYDGALMQPEVRAFIEDADQVLAISALMTDFNTGAFTSQLDAAKTISIGKHRMPAGDKTFFNVELADLLKILTARLKRRDWPKIARKTLGAAKGAGADKIAAAALYPRLASFCARTTF